MKGFFTGFFVCLALVSCAGLSFKYYGLKDVVYEHGILLGPKEKEDLPFSKCQPNGQSKNPCVVMFAAEFFQFKQDYEDLQEKLKHCQKP